MGRYLEVNEEMELDGIKIKCVEDWGGCKDVDGNHCCLTDQQCVGDRFTRNRGKGGDAESVLFTKIEEFTQEK